MSAVSENGACIDFIRGIPLPNHQSTKCLGMPAYYECVREQVNKDCQQEGIDMLQQAITSFGCNYINNTIQGILITL